MRSVPAPRGLRIELGPVRVRSFAKLLAQLLRLTVGGYAEEGQIDARADT